MIMIYFSGTGNSKYIAEKFSDIMGIKSYCIEADIDFDALLSKTETLAVCYPIYGSSVPRIMREFAERHKSYMQNKKLIIFCTQMFFSGDGARAFARLLPGCEKNVIYAEHFNMPCNISNIPFLPIHDKTWFRKKKSVDKKLGIVCHDIKNHIVKKRGWSWVSTMLGKTQNTSFYKTEIKGRSSFKADDNCTKCGLCVRKCPMHNLEIIDNKVIQKDNCMLCYRCVNICPQRAASVFVNHKPKRQYKGMSLMKNKNL